MENYGFHNRAVYTRENKPRLTLAAAYTRRERNHLYEYGLHKTRIPRINSSRLSSRKTGPMMKNFVLVPPRNFQQ